MQDGGRPHNTQFRSLNPPCQEAPCHQLTSWELQTWGWLLVYRSFFLHVLNGALQSPVTVADFMFYDGTRSLSGHCPVFFPGLNFVLSMVSLC